MKKINLITSLHKSTKRDYIGRMTDDKIMCMKEAKKFERNYWDGSRRFGYGGYKYIPGRWMPVAEKLIKYYKLNNKSKVLDVGCGKAFLLYEIKKILPKISIVGIDISKHGIKSAPKEIRKFLKIKKAQSKLDYPKNYFDLTISLACLHNLEIFDLKKSIKEIQRVSKKKYIMVESYRNEQELFNLQCWALTCNSFFSEKEWLWLYKDFGYTGDYEFIYF